MVFSQVAAAFASQRNKWFLSSVIFFGLGCALYFCLPARVSVAQSVIALILLIAAFWRARSHAVLAFVLQLGGCLVAGLLIGAVHTALGPTQILTRTLHDTTVVGTISALEPRANRLRATIEPMEIAGLSQDRLDWKVRLSFLGDSDLAIGDRITARARLFPLRPPSVPGDPDFSRSLYYSNIGATGFVFGRQFTVERGDKSFFVNDISGILEVARQKISAVIDAHMSAPEAGIAKALIIGERGDVHPDIAEDLRRSGLAHLLAISGLHMGLLCGTVFFLIRYGLAAIPQVALRFPIKKWAAMAAMMAGMIYLGLSGATVPTQRAFIMLVVVWLALLLDRRAISLRLVGVAAVVVLALRPDAVLGASFQLSFAAVGALVAFYDGPGRRWLDRQGTRPWYERSIAYAIGLIITGAIVTVVTAPIIGFHFGRISVLGVIANLIAIPVMAFWVMPMIVASLALMTVGLGGAALWAMKPGLTVLLQTAAFIGAQDWGLWYVSGIDATAVSLAMLALTWCIVWQDKWAVLPVVPLVIWGCAAQLSHQSSDILISGDRESWAVYDRGEQRLHVADGISDFQQSVWMGRFGIAPEEAETRVVSCASDPCRIVPGGQPDAKGIIIGNRIANPFYACRNADIVVDLQADLPGDDCRKAGAKVLIDDDVLWWRGGVAIRPSDRAATDTVIETVRDTAGGWPWIIIGGKVAQ